MPLSWVLLDGGKEVGGYQRPREIWLSRDSEPRQLQVFTRAEEEEPRVQICAGAGRGYGLSTTVSLGRYPSGGRGRQEGLARTGLCCPEGANPGRRAPPAGRPSSQERRSEVGGESLEYPNNSPPT